MMGCLRCAPFPTPLPLLGRGSSRHPWRRMSGLILTLLCGIWQVSYPLWAQLPNLKNRDINNHGLEQEPGAGLDRGASSPGEHSAADILLLFLLVFVALQLQGEASPLHLHLLLPGALSSIPGSNPVAFPQCRHCRDSFDGHVFCTEKSCRNCILPKVSAGEKIFPESLMSVDVGELVYGGGQGSNDRASCPSQPPATPSPAMPKTRALPPPLRSLPGFSPWIVSYIHSQNPHFSFSTMRK